MYTRLTTRLKQHLIFAQPLRERDFAFLWAGQLISSLGDSIWTIAIAWQVLAMGSAADLARVMVFYSTPQIILLLLGGIVIDHLPRRMLMGMTDLIRGFAVLGVVVLLLLNKLEIWHLYGVSALLGLGSALYNPAFKSMLREIFDTSNLLLQSNALVSFSSGVRRIIGPAIGGLMIALVGVTGGMISNMISFFVSAVCVTLIQRRAERQMSKQPLTTSSRLKQYWQGLAEGFRAVAKSPWIRTSICFSMAINVAVFGPLLVGLPALVQATFNDVAILGLLTAAEGGASVLTALAIGQYGRVPRRGLVAYGGIFSAGLGLLLLGGMAQTTWLILGLLGMVLVGLGTIVFTVIWDTTVQEMIPHEVLGRVVSIDYFVSFALLPLTYTATGTALQYIPVTSVFIIGATITMFLSGLLMTTHTIRYVK